MTISSTSASRWRRDERAGLARKVPSVTLTSSVLADRPCCLGAPLDGVDTEPRALKRPAAGVVSECLSMRRAGMRHCLAMSTISPAWERSAVKTTTRTMIATEIASVPKAKAAASAQSSSKRRSELVVLMSHACSTRLVMHTPTASMRPSVNA